MAQPVGKGSEAEVGAGFEAAGLREPTGGGTGGSIASQLSPTSGEGVTQPSYSQCG